MPSASLAEPRSPTASPEKISSSAPSAPELKSQAPAGPKEKAIEYGTIEIRKIIPGYVTEDLVEVNKGLQEDELVVVEVQEEFKDKAKVEIAEVQEGVL